MVGGKKERAASDLGKGKGGGQYGSPTIPACKYTFGGGLSSVDCGLP